MLTGGRSCIWSRRLSSLIVVAVLSFTACSSALTAAASESVKHDPEKYLGLSTKQLLAKFRQFDMKWTESKPDARTPKDLQEFVVPLSGFDVLCMSGYVIEVNLYAPDGEKNGYAGLMPKALSWGDTLSAIKTKLGKPQHEEDVADHDAYYVGYETKGRRFILTLNRSTPRKLRGIRIQARPTDEP